MCSLVRPNRCAGADTETGDSGRCGGDLGYLCNLCKPSQEVAVTLLKIRKAVSNVDQLAAFTLVMLQEDSFEWEIK